MSFRREQCYRTYLCFGFRAEISQPFEYFPEAVEIDLVQQDCVTVIRCRRCLCAKTLVAVITSSSRYACDKSLPLSVTIRLPLARPQYRSSFQMYIIGSDREPGKIWESSRSEPEPTAAVRSKYLPVHARGAQRPPTRYTGGQLRCVAGHTYGVYDPGYAQVHPRCTGIPRCRTTDGERNHQFPRATSQKGPSGYCVGARRAPSPRGHVTATATNTRTFVTTLPDVSTGFRANVLVVLGRRLTSASPPPPPSGGPIFWHVAAAPKTLR